MIEPWELILHHTYAGTPGVVFDHSPGHGSHGRLVGIDAGSFVTDGARNGSGAVGFQQDGMIVVEPTRGWDRLGGVRAEVTFRCDHPEDQGYLFYSRTSRYFSAIVVEDKLNFSFEPTLVGPATGMQSFTVRLADIGVNPREWTMAGVQYDGLGTVQVTVNGATVLDIRDRRLHPVLPITELIIGNEPGGDLPFRGLIDELKVWRPNAVRIHSDFTDRIVEHGVTDCWVDWGTKFRDAIDDLDARDPECVGRILHLLDAAMTGVAPPILTHSEATRQAWDRAVAEYQRLWSQGDLAAIRPVLAGLDAALKAEGVDIEQMPAYRALLDDRCFQELIGNTPRLDCDPQFTRMLAGDGS